ncbi:WD40/YVTN/BNR-like repeat-containing protein [Labilibacter marinus]|uniref:WD40/YVTN/BNR-like repeat-containing protein n=1 Tax=Labilibacter marinus TaxID=1477105 RepID=UPI00082D38C2|nr:glycosyl hydrolase [Labilibacter marinus]
MLKYPFNKITPLLLVFGILFNPNYIIGQKKDKKNADKEEPAINSSLVSGLKLRSIGPAFTSGRIADFAVNPNDHTEFYVGVASGNIWKTSNNGTTFEPVFDNYGSYSIGCLAMDPTNTNVVWAGTGENNHQRALGYGDGIYKTVDGGKSWQNMGLKESRQIGMILIDPRNPDVVYVAAEGSVWGAGGERGLYKTIDGGETWNRVLEISEHTGVNNIICDPRNPDILYATTEQRRRHVHTKIGGGPESAVYKSTNAGKDWTKLSKGLPSEHMGGMGIAISPQKPDVLYLIIEAANNAGGFFRSSDRGESWEKMSDHHSSGQYYNEIYCDPIEFDKIYSVETYSHVTTDGGKNWSKISNKDRHVDDHAIWIDPTNNKHFMIGGDGGVYITYDDGDNWRQVSNLPITQFYRVTVDNAEPFYNVYGGTQDNATLGGPVKNTSTFGVTSGEWIVTVFGDGFWSRVDPTNPDIVYSEWQYGNVVRYDKKSGEKIMIKPQPGKEEKTYRWNWNSPLILSKHSHTTIYMAANKLFKSADRGNTWQVISDDLTAQIDRNTWPVMGKYWSTDAVQKDVSTSQYNTIVSLDESPLKPGLIYVGTDDGVIQVTEDDGKTWSKTSSFEGVPEYTYVSDIYASRFDENVVYACFDNMKNDDFKPYILKSIDKGKTWISISSNLPENGTVHTLEQDFKSSNLLFAGTEFGVFFSIDEGNNWTQLKEGIPTIAVKDLAIQERENDLVLATFGRGFYVLDDYSPLRDLSEELTTTEAHLFPIKNADLYIQTGKIYGQGATYYGASNPAYGATFSFYQKEVPKTKKEIRKEKEKTLFEKGERIPQPSWKTIENEKEELPAYLVLNIKDNEGNLIRTMTKKPSKGISRFTWDLKYNSQSILNTSKFEPIKKSKGGIFVLPGSYTIEINQVFNGEAKPLAGPQTFTIDALSNTTLPAKNRAQMVAFQKEISDLSRAMNGSLRLCNELKAEIASMKQTALYLDKAHQELITELNRINQDLDAILFSFNGLKAKASWEEIPPVEMPLMNRLNSIIYAQINSTSDITSTSQQSFEILKEQFPPVLEKLKNIVENDMLDVRKKLDQLNAPYTKGRVPIWK